MNMKGKKKRMINVINGITKIKEKRLENKYIMKLKWKKK